jgi:hypothetical protein
MIIEIPPEITAKMNRDRISPNFRALDIAKRVAEQQSLFSPQSYFPYHSETVAKVGDSSKLGKPVLVAEDGSKAWIVRRPTTHEKRSSSTGTQG